MRNIKTTVILSAIVLLSVIGFVGSVDAAGPSLYISPASLTKTVGNIFSASMGLNASGNKVFAVEGTLVFNNLFCQSITVTDGLMAQSVPTCSNPHFLIGIPNGTSLDKTLLTLSVKAVNAGVASVGLTGVDIIGEGVSIGSAATGGNYTINAVPKPTPTTPQASDGFIGYVNGKLQTFPTREAAQQAGATGIQPNYQYNPAETTTTPTTPAEEPTEEGAVLGEQAPVTQEPTAASQPISRSLLASVGSVVSLGTNSVAVGLLVAVIVLALAGYAIYAVIQRARRKNLGKLR